MYFRAAVRAWRGELSSDAQLGFRTNASLEADGEEGLQAQVLG